MFELKEGMDKYVIDFTEIQSYYEIHSVIAEALDFPDWYGRNWDAFWDLITDMIGTPIHIEIIGLNALKRVYEPAAESFLRVLKDAKHYCNDKYVGTIKIELVDENGKTEIN